MTKEIETSIMIPILNEEKYIEHTVNSVINGTENIEDMELLLVDGGSTDNTLNILQELSDKHQFIKILHNKKREIAPALNLAIKESKGKYIVRMDAHAEFPKGYVNSLINSLKNMPPDVVNVGGTLETKSMSGKLIGESIAIVSSSKIGVGNTTFRTEKIEEIRYVETVPFGAYKKDALISVGCFSENVPTSEDLELGKKILASGGKIVMIPNLSFIYFCREDIRSFIIQHFDNGRCVTKENRGGIQSFYFSLKDLFLLLIGTVKEKDNNSTSTSFYKPRHYIPMLFAIYLIVLINLFIFSKYELMNLISSIPLLIYICIALIFGLKNSFERRNALYSISIPTMLMTLHLSYGFGSIYGIFQLFFPKLKSIKRK